MAAEASLAADEAAVAALAAATLASVAALAATAASEDAASSVAFGLQAAVNDRAATRRRRRGSYEELRRS